MRISIPATVVSLMVVFTAAVPGNLRSGADNQNIDMRLSTMTIRGDGTTPPETPASSPEEACERLDDAMKNGVYAALEEFNEKVGTSFAIISDGTENGYIPAPSQEFPHTVDTGIAAAYSAQIEVLNSMITQAREISEPRCAMPGAGNVLHAFARIAWMYEFLAENEARNRREGIITPEMYNRPKPRFMI